MGVRGRMTFTLCTHKDVGEIDEQPRTEVERDRKGKCEPWLCGDCNMCFEWFGADNGLRFCTWNQNFKLYIFAIIREWKTSDCVRCLIYHWKSKIQPISVVGLVFFGFLIADRSLNIVYCLFIVFEYFKKEEVRRRLIMILPIGDLSWLQLVASVMEYLVECKHEIHAECKHEIHAAVHVHL